MSIALAGWLTGIFVEGISCPFIYCAFVLITSIELYLYSSPSLLVQLGPKSENIHLQSCQNVVKKAKVGLKMYFHAPGNHLAMWSPTTIIEPRAPGKPIRTAVPRHRVMVSGFVLNFRSESPFVL